MLAAVALPATYIHKLMHTLKTLLETGKYHQVPIIIGYNSDEGILNLAAYLQGNIQFEEVDKVRSNVFSIIKDK